MSKTKEMRNPENSVAHILHSIKTQDLMLKQPLNQVSPIAFATSLRVLMQNWRQGTVACKGRSDVARSNKKPWKQKGTGRARAGSARSPLWRGGGVIHGPQARVRELTLIKKTRKQVFETLLANFISTSKISYVDWELSSGVPKTREAAAVLKQAGLYGKNILLFVSPQDHEIHASFANMKNVQILYFDHPNVFDLANAQHWVFLKKNMDDFKEMVAKWI